MSLLSINFTFGKSHSDITWTDRRSMGWLEFAGMFTSAPVGTKNGSCYTPAVFRGASRNLNDADQIDMLVLDSDCGHTLEEITKAVRARGWSAIVHSTYSHMETETDISRKAYDLWASGRQAPDAEQYFREKKGYLDSVIAGAKIVDERGMNYVVQHNPCPRFRVLIPLSSPWRAVAYESQPVANAKWRSRVQAAAYALGLFHDQSCTDTSRLFYFPRVRTEGAPFVSQMIDGDLCDLWSLADAPAAMPETSAASMFAPRARSIAEQRKMPLMSGDLDLRTWIADQGLRFEIVSALKARGVAKLGRRESGVKQHFVCPFDDEHTTAGDATGFFAVNSSDLAKANLTQITAGFVCKCKHDSCSHRDRLDHLAKMIELGWLTREDLLDNELLAPDLTDKVDLSLFRAKLDQGAQRRRWKF